MKTQTVVAAYQDAQDAHRVVEALRQAGIPRDFIHAFPDRDFFAEEERVEAERLRAHQQRPAIHFFKDLFGLEETHRHDFDAYAEAVRRGHYIVAVKAASLEMVDQVTAILNNANVDINARAARWREQGWTRHDEHAPAMTADEIRRDRALYPTNSDLHDGPGSYAGKLLDKTAAALEGSEAASRTASPNVERHNNAGMHSSTMQRDSFDAARGPDGMPQPAAGMDATMHPASAASNYSTAPTATTAPVASTVSPPTGTSGASGMLNTTGTSEPLARPSVATGTTVAPGASMGMDDDTEFRRHWQSSYGSSGGRYEEYDSAYRHGASIGRDSRFNSYRWEEVEPHARSDWETRHPDSAWDKVKDAVRYAAERVTGHHRH